jgi:hypothetical protein
VTDYHPEDLIEGSGVQGKHKKLPRPHRIQVEQCEEGTHILCECGALFEEQGLPALLLFLESHSR